MYGYESDKLRYALSKIVGRITSFRNLFILRNLLLITLSVALLYLIIILGVIFSDSYSTPLLKYLKPSLLVVTIILTIFGVSQLFYLSGKRLFRVIRPYNYELYSHLLGCYELLTKGNRDYSKELIADYATGLEEFIKGLKLRRYLFTKKIKYLLYFLSAILLILFGITALEYRSVKKLFQTNRVAVVEKAGILIDIGKVKKEFFYPAYSGLEKVIRYDDRRSIEALKGTVLRIWVENKIGADYAQIISSDTKQNMKEDGRYYTADIGLNESGLMRIDLLKRGQRYSSYDFKIKVIPDENPEIYLSGPEEILRGSIEANVDRKVRLSYSAVDDFGVSKINIVVSLADGKEKSFGIKEVVPPQRDFSGEYLWDYSELARYVQGEIMFALEVEDNDTISGPKRNRTRFYKILVPSSSESFTADIKALKLLRGEMLHLLSLNLTYQDAGEFISEREEKGIKSETLKGIDIFLSKRGKKDSIYLELKRIKGEISHYNNVILPTVKRLKRDRLTGLPSMLINLILDETKMLEKNILVLQDIIDEVVYFTLSVLAREMSELRNELKSLMKEYEESKNEELRIRIMAVLNLLEHKIKEYKNIQSELATSFSDINVNVNSLKNLSGNMENLSKRLAELKENLSLDEMAKFKDRLGEIDNMISEVENDFGNMLSKLDSDKFKELMETLKGISSDIERVMDEEKKIASELSRVEMDMKKRYYNAIKDVLDKRLSEIIEMVRSLNNDLSRDAHIIKKRSRDMREYETTVETQAVLKQLLDTLNNRQIVESLMLSNQVVAKMEWIKNIAVMFNEDREYIKMSEGFYNRALKIRDEIKEILGSSKPSLSSEERKRLDKLLSSQQRLLGEMDKLSSKSEKLLSEFGSNFEKLNENIRAANSSMRLSSSSMKANDVPVARSNAEDSISRLDDALRELSRMQKRRAKMLSQSEEGEGEGGKERFRTAEVKLPGREDFKPNKRLREEIMKALQDEEIKGYEEFIRRYYEEIIK
ncbi:MAG: DUF4175 family protein [Myxococcota bacterium]